jgi:hypothetical protein
MNCSFRFTDDNSSQIQPTVKSRCDAGVAPKLPPPEDQPPLGQIAPLVVAQAQLLPGSVELLLEDPVWALRFVVTSFLDTSSRYSITCCCRRFIQPAITVRKIMACVFKAYLFRNLQVLVNQG